MTKTTSVSVKADKPADRPAIQGEAWPRLGSLRDEIERLFDAFEPRQWFDRPLGLASNLPTQVVPAMDLVENGKAWVMTFEVPGIAPDAIDVKLANGTLTVSGEKTEEKKEEGEDYLLSERRWGSFRRSVRLPDGVDAAGIEASHKNGVLTVRLPKSATALAAEKSIAVKTA